MLPFDFAPWKRQKAVKQHIIIDTLSLILVVVVHAANIHDSKGTIEVIANLKGRFPKLRRIVERTFSLLESFRKLSKDYEVLPETSQTMIYQTMIQIMLNRVK